MNTAIAELIATLRDEQTVPLALASVPEPQLAEMGLRVDAGMIHWPKECAALDAQRIQASLLAMQSERPIELEVLAAVDSTNDWLRASADSFASGWRAVTTEYQLAGKGRLGRSWSTPIGGSIAVSVGLRIERSADALGGLSLVTGLAALDTLDPKGQLGLSLKWPNDIQSGSRKLGGILIEILRSRRNFTDLIVGVGLNYRLTDKVKAQIDKETTDLAHLGVTRSRNEILAGLLVQLSRFVVAFERRGFADFQAAFNDAHLYQGKHCRVIGGETVSGQVQGVDEQGQLLLQVDGTVRHFSAGEVSLRER